MKPGGLKSEVQHQNPSQYLRQKVLIVAIDECAYLVPFVEEDDYFFLNTIIPRRKATRDFIARGKSDDEA
jgi:hypothetical protein